LDNESLAKEAVAILRSHDSPSAQQWSQGLDSLLDADTRTRDPIFASARSTLEAASDPIVLESCSRTDLDLKQFLLTGSTLYIIGTSNRQRVIAPLIAGLVDSIANAAMELAATYDRGRLKTPLILALDEVANIASLESLPALVSEGGGRGIITVWAIQNLAQLRDRYGPEKAKGIIAATAARLVFGGLSRSEDLDEISSWAGEMEVPKETVQRTPTGFLQVQVSRSVTMERVPVLPVGKLQQLPHGVAALFYRSHPLEMVRVTPAGAEPYFASVVGSDRYRAAISEPAKPETSPPPERKPAAPTVQEPQVPEPERTPAPVER